MVEILNLPPKQADAVNKEIGPSKFCPGCGHGLTLNNLGFAIDELNLKERAVFGCDIGCSLLAWNFMNVDSVQTHHGRTTPVIYGITRAVPGTVGIAYMGDGGGYAIGAQHLVNAATRNEKMLVLLVNNTNYGMTGGQMAPTTLPGQVTETTPYGREVDVHGKPFLGPEMVAAITGDDNYVARASVSNLRQLRTFIKRGLTNVADDRGFSFVEVLSLCPLNWRTNNIDTWDRLKKMEEFFKVGELRVPEELKGVK
ncbi:MAG: thiamine pyrophosphate-dependent enzyme [Vampirovibrionia bacterium]